MCGNHIFKTWLLFIVFWKVFQFIPQNEVRKWKEKHQLLYDITISHSGTLVIPENIFFKPLNHKESNYHKTSEQLQKGQLLEKVVRNKNSSYVFSSLQVAKCFCLRYITWVASFYCKRGQAGGATGRAVGWEGSGLCSPVSLWVRPLCPCEPCHWD